MRRKLFSRPFFSCLLVLLGTTTGYGKTLALTPGEVQSTVPSAGSQDTLLVKIIRGQDGINIVRRHSAAGAVVEVRDQHGRPVAGAVVRFDSPLSEPSVTFISGSHTFSTVTELDGRASVAGLVPLGVGAFQIEVTVKYGDLATAVSVINQTNYQSQPPVDAATPGVRKTGSTSQLTSDARSSHSRLSSNAVKAIVIAVAAGAATGIALGLHHGSNQSSTGAVGVGTPVAGAPH